MGQTDDGPARYGAPKHRYRSGSQLILTNSFPPSSLQLFGVGQLNEGVLLDASQSPGFALIFDKTGGSVLIDGSSSAANAPAVKILGPATQVCGPESCTALTVINVSGGTTLTMRWQRPHRNPQCGIYANPGDPNGPL
jgi:hypothetical protein